MVTTLRRLLPAAVLFSTSLLAAPAEATWSIIIVNTKTHEVAIATATCLDGFDLELYLPVLQVGVGAAACQSAVDQNGTNRARIWTMLQQGHTPQEILQRLAANDNHHQTRQYGIVTLPDFPLTFTGTQCGEARYGIAGIADDLRYAVQGNVLTGVAPVYAAELAILSTNGDVSQKLIAAMEAARSYGGDGRCSCDMFNPTHCGSPPPTFTYSSYTTCFVVSRIGDVDGTCNVGQGCINGSYWCNLDVISGAGGPEPVLALEARYAQWRAAQAGIADQIKTRVSENAQSLVADGATGMDVDVELRDIDDHPVINNPATLSVEADGPANPNVVIGAVNDLGSGHYRFHATAGTQSGTGHWRVIVHHANRNVRVWPDLDVRVDPLVPLHSGFDVVSAQTGASIPLVVNFGAANAGAAYVILGSASGTVPGQLFQGLALPLNADAFFAQSLAGGGPFVGTSGQLDLSGRATGAYIAAPGALSTLIGVHIDWAAVRLPAGANPGSVSNNASFVIAP